MGNLKIKFFSFRANEELLNKLGYIARYEGRSSNSQLRYLVQDCVKQYELNYGEINSEDLKTSK